MDRSTPRLPNPDKTTEPEENTRESPCARPQAGDKGLGDLRAAREHAAAGRGTHAARELRDGESRTRSGHVRPVPPHVDPRPEVDDGDGLATDGGRHDYPVELHAPKLPDAHRRLRLGALAADYGDTSIAVQHLRAALTAAEEGR